MAFEPKDGETIVYPWRLFNIVQQLAYSLNWASLQNQTQRGANHWISFDRFVEMPAEE